MSGQVSIRKLKERKLAILQEKKRRSLRDKLSTYYPETGPYRRELYAKHMEFFKAGATHRQRAFMAANRVGKTEGGGGYEIVLHLTGEYPDWWEGRRFDRPITAWAAGDTTQTTRDTCQFKLLGDIEKELGTGLLPGDAIQDIKRKAGSVPNCVETVYVKHKSGGISRLTFKSYDQKRKAFQGTEQDVIWLDEEPPEDIYEECLVRTMTTNGLMMLTFTPLLGLSQVVTGFLLGGKIPKDGQSVIKKSKYLVSATWDDVPHLTEEAKEELLADFAPFQREARSKGIPQLGAGAIYPIPEEDYTVSPFDIPKYWPRAYALDVGWNCTAAIWGAWDRENDIIYLYLEHKRGHAEPVVHADAVKRNGEWMLGAVDPASLGASQKDGENLFDAYTDLGLNLVQAVNSVEYGIHKVWERLSSGRLKVFSTMTHFFEEIRLYRRDEHGKVVKENDHVMDITRYLIATKDEVFTEMPIEVAYAKPELQSGVTDYDPFGEEDSYAY